MGRSFIESNGSIDEKGAIMTIPVWGYLKEFEAEKEEIFAAIEKVLRSGKLILGPSVSTFETEFAKFCESEYGVGVNNATDGLFLALKAMGLAEQDEVICVPNTAVPTISAITSTGAITKFVDIDPSTYLMDVTQVEKLITPKTKCLLPVHLYGQCVPMKPLLDLAKKYDLWVLEDCAQSHGAKQNGKLSGSMGDASVFSFYPTKILGGYGDAGMIVTADLAITEKLRRLRFYGMEKSYFSIEHGYNSRLDELHAEILLRKMKHLPGYITRRKQIATRYDKELAGLGLGLPKTLPENDHAYYLYVVRHAKRDLIMEKLKAVDILVNISYPWPIHIMPAFEHLGYKQGDFPHTEKAAQEIFSIPMFPSLTDEEQGQVISALKKIVGELN